MFESSFIKKYLTPSRKQLSVSLIALLSTGVITLVVWLITLFLSITEGIEKAWLDKLTSLNAPLRLQPTAEYFDSYYYKIDRYSLASHYLSKTLGEKARALLTNPYDPAVDEELPSRIVRADTTKEGTLKDPVKTLISCLKSVEPSFGPLIYQDVQISGALLRLELIRRHSDIMAPPMIEPTTPGDSLSRVAPCHSSIETQNLLTQVCYLSSLPENNPHLPRLLLPPTLSDLNHLLSFAPEAPLTKALFSSSSSLKIEKVKTARPLWEIPLSLLPELEPFAAAVYFSSHGQGKVLSHFILFDGPPDPSLETTLIMRKGSSLLLYKKGDQTPKVLENPPPLFSLDPLEFSVTATLHSPLRYVAMTAFQGKKLEGEISPSGLEVSKIHTPSSCRSKELFEKTSSSLSLLLPKWGDAQGAFLAKQFRDSGVKMGDKGYLSYSAATPLGNQEMRLPIYVCGFYDPGIMPVGNKSIFVPPEIPQTINATDNPFSLEKSESNQFLVWFAKLEDAPKIKVALQEKLIDAGIDRYWHIETFQDFPFAKDLMQQFQSDKYLFTLVGGLILLVACTNIISLLILLVSNKKKEIAILMAMGAKKSSIAAIFATSGALLGVFSCLIGLSLAFFTLQHIDSLVHILSLLQGHEPFNAQFFGQTLPKEISDKALWFALLVTPLLSLLAGLIPAFKAASVSPCDILRSE